MHAERLQSAYQTARCQLLQQRVPEGHWEGELASSALSTATAVSALSVVANQQKVPAPQTLVDGGLNWLAANQNTDGGWGDTDRSYSNIATTMLVRAAVHLAGASNAARWPERLDDAERWIERHDGLAGLRRRYGRDKTFAVPILSNCALAGLVDWKDVAPLPFELACFPQSMYRFLQMPVVSYAVPALVAIGQARHLAAPSPWPWIRWLRRWAVKPSLRALRRMQPDSGGYLEATPLTSFVVMNLAGSGRPDHDVVRSGVDFLVRSARKDGSWPIDTNLATWNTTLSLNALAAGGEDLPQLVDCLPWLLACQHRRRHPFTGAEPGGWGWSDLSGAVPDADDTPGALLSLDAWRRSRSCSDEQRRLATEAAWSGLRWLRRLQNRDGGWPTFCRGWGKLPFDRSGSDLTAHALRALGAWKDQQSMVGNLRQWRAMLGRGWRYLSRTQRPDGSWTPLWFGNQDDPEEENPVYGTAKVLLAYRDWQRLDDPCARRGVDWLRDCQNADGGWGGGPAQTLGVGRRPQPGCAAPTTSTLEETALAVQALLGADGGDPSDPGSVEPLVERGLEWLCARLESQPDELPESAPIGFYFAKLWYYESLYPLMFTTATLGQACRRLGAQLPPSPPALHTA